MRLIDGGAHDETAHRCALYGIAASLRRLVANAIDLSNGGGRPADLEDDAEMLLTSLDSYIQAAGGPPNAKRLSEALTWRLRAVPKGEDLMRPGEASPNPATIKAALDLVAALFRDGGTHPYKADDPIA